MIVTMERYQTELSRIFTKQARITFQVKVERAWLEALTKRPVTIKSLVTAGRVSEIESKTKHDVMAMTLAMRELIDDPEQKRLVHTGLTSQDINDTVLAIQLHMANAVILRDIQELTKTLRGLVEIHKETTCLARTHGQPALPITYGYKFANYLQDFSVLSDEYAGTLRLIKGKLHGAVGTQASMKLMNREGLGEEVLGKLGLTCWPVSTQVVSRHFLVSHLFSLIQITNAIGRFAKELRDLSRIEIGEVGESFESGQVGSSTMPHKRNPVSCETICGLVRVVQSQLAPLMTTASCLEHERDLANSSVERIAVETIIVLSHYIVQRFHGVLKGLAVDGARAKENLSVYYNDSERRMIQAVLDGRDRSEVHGEIKKASQSEVGSKPEEYLGTCLEAINQCLAEYH